MRYENSIKNFECILKNLNFKGFHACLKKELPAQDVLKLTVILPSNESFTSKVKVIWKKALPEGILYGFYIIAMKDSEKNIIYSFINKERFPDLVKLWWQGIK